MDVLVLLLYSALVLRALMAVDRPVAAEGRPAREVGRIAVT